MRPDRPRRVAIVSPYSLSEPGGVQGQVLGLARAVRSHGVDARVIGPCDGPPPEPGVVTVGGTTRYDINGSVAPIASGKVVARRTLEALRAFMPDVAHLHEPFVPGPTHAVVLGATIPMVATFHAFGNQPWYERMRKVVERLSRRFGVTTAVSEDAARLVRAYVPGAELSIVPNGVEIERFADAEPWPSDRPAVLFVGRHEDRKGLSVLVDAWAGLERDAVLWVAGTGPQTDELRDRGVADVEWVGRISEHDKARRLRGARVFCAPSLHGESFGVVLLEAMAAGAPVVASDIDGYRNVTRPGLDGLMVAPGDAGALRDALRLVLDDPAERARLAKASRARAEEYSMARLAERYLGLYEEAIDRAAVPA